MFTRQQLDNAYKRSGNEYAGALIHQLSLSKQSCADELNFAKIARQKEVKEYIIEKELR